MIEERKKRLHFVLAGLRLKDRDGDELHRLILCDPVGRPLSSETRLLDPSEGDARLGDEPGVDSDHAALEVLRDSERTGEILGVEVFVRKKSKERAEKREGVSIPLVASSSFRLGPAPEDE